MYYTPEEHESIKALLLTAVTSSDSTEKNTAIAHIGKFFRHRRSDYNNMAMKIFVKAGIDGGNAEAIFEMAGMYEHGQGVSRDLSEAIKYYRYLSLCQDEAIAAKAKFCLGKLLLSQTDDRRVIYSAMMAQPWSPQPNQASPSNDDDNMDVVVSDTLRAYTHVDVIDSQKMIELQQTLGRALIGSVNNIESAIDQLWPSSSSPLLPPAEKKKLLNVILKAEPSCVPYDVRVKTLHEYAQLLEEENDPLAFVMLLEVIYSGLSYSEEDKCFVKKKYFRRGHGYVRKFQLEAAMKMHEYCHPENESSWFLEIAADFGHLDSMCKYALEEHDIDYRIRLASMGHELALKYLFSLSRGPYGLYPKKVISFAVNRITYKGHHPDQLWYVSALSIMAYHILTGGFIMITTDITKMKELYLKMYTKQDDDEKKKKEIVDDHIQLDAEKELLQVAEHLSKVNEISADDQEEVQVVRREFWGVCVKIGNRLMEWDYKKHHRMVEHMFGKVVSGSDQSMKETAEKKLAELRTLMMPPPPPTPQSTPQSAPQLAPQSAPQSTPQPTPSPPSEAQSNQKATSLGKLPASRPQHTPTTLGKRARVPEVVYIPRSESSSAGLMRGGGGSLASLCEAADMVLTSPPPSTKRSLPESTSAGTDTKKQKSS